MWILLSSCLVNTRDQMKSDRILKHHSFPFPATYSSSCTLMYLSLPTLRNIYASQLYQSQKNGIFILVVQGFFEDVKDVQQFLRVFYNLNLISRLNR